MLENFFLTYANINLKDNPKNLLKLVGVISIREDHCQEDHEIYYDIAHTINFFLNNEEIDDNQPFNLTRFLSIAKEVPYIDREKLIEKIKQDYPKLYSDDDVFGYFIYVYDVAYQATYNMGDCLNCDAEPPLFLRGSFREMPKSRSNLFGRELFREINKLNCYECDQLHFIHILSDIVEGKEYESIEGFYDLIYLENENTTIKRSTLEIKKTNNDLYETSLTNNEFVEFPINVENMASRDFNIWHGVNPFRLGIMSAGIYSLTKFLLNNDRRKLHRCDECNNFYRSESIRKQRFCSDKCRLKWHNRRRIESGEHREYKRRKRKEGAKESYYG